MTEHVGPYRLVEPIGAGGTALVYRAERAGRESVAVKCLRPQFAADPAVRRRFLREAELARRLDHPGILGVLDAGEEEGVPFLAMELVRGETLRQRLEREGKLSLEAAGQIFTALARALDHAHQHGIIHRDLKPENIFVTPHGVKLGDFGNARVVSLASVTGASLSWGTPEYVAPEVFVRGRADPRSDLYSLGAVLYEMVTGRLPWTRAETLMRLGGRARETAVLAPTGCGAAVDRLIADLLAYAPDGRPACGEEAIVRFSAPAGAAAIRMSNCSSCGAPRPDDLPRCLDCGQAVSGFAHNPDENWRLVLRSLADDAARIATLLQLIDSLAEPRSRLPLFLTGDMAMYSAEEASSGIEVPAVLFSELDEATARQLQRLFASRGVDAVAEQGLPPKWMLKTDQRASLRTVLAGSLTFALALGSFIHNWFVGAGVAGAFAVGVIARRHARRRRLLREAQGTWRLRPRIATMPNAERLLLAAASGATEVRAPEVARLFADVSVELYRLTQRAETLAASAPGPSSELDLLRRTIAAAPALLERLRSLATRLDDLDHALAGPTEGELMQMMARLERANAAADGDRASLATTRRDLEASIERRHATEQTRAELSARLCQLLGRLRLVYQHALLSDAPGNLEAQTLEAATAEVDAWLAAPGAR